MDESQSRVVRRSLLAFGLTSVPIVVGLVNAPAASAAMVKICTGYSGCAAAGYSDFGYGAVNGTPYWGMDPGHNCTNYAAYRLIRNGVDASYLRGQGMAHQWGDVARNHGVRVDNSPRVGDIAWWDKTAGLGSAGHVAYVEQVGNGYIVVSQDAFGGDFSWARYTPRSLYPTGFIHFGGVRDLFFIKTKNTGSGKVEVHNALAADSYQKSSLHATSWFSTADQNNGWFQMVGRDLFFIKKIGRATCRERVL